MSEGACVLYKTGGNLTTGRPSRPEMTTHMYTTTNQPRPGTANVQRSRARAREEGTVQHHQLILSSSTSNRSVELGGITGGKPRAPYACEERRNERRKRKSAQFIGRTERPGSGVREEKDVRSPVLPSGSPSHPGTAVVHLTER